MANIIPLIGIVLLGAIKSLIADQVRLNYDLADIFTAYCNERQELR
jgi:hypothetical protein